MSQITLSKKRKEDLENLLADEVLSIFIDEDTKDVIREKCKGKLDDWWLFMIVHDKTIKLKYDVWEKLKEMKIKTKDNEETFSDVIKRVLKQNDRSPM